MTTRRKARPSKYLRIRRSKGAFGICGDYDIVHTPTGLIVHSAGPNTINRLIDQIDKLDWNFRNAETIPLHTRERAAKLVKQAIAWQARHVDKLLHKAKDRMIDVCY